MFLKVITFNYLDAIIVHVNMCKTKYKYIPT